jgi:carboxymethylenebutenolidase
MTSFKVIAESPSLLREDGRDYNAYLARPAEGAHAAIMILTEMFGLNEPMRELARSYAQQGFVALVPNLFWRSEVPGGLSYEGVEREIAWQRLRDLDFDAAGHDLATATRWLRNQSFCTGKVGAIGFCAGGRLAFIAAARANVDAAISLYALGITHHIAEMPQVGCPTQLHYGLKDQHVPRAEIDQIAEAARGWPLVEIHLYPEAGHSFFNAVRPTYDPQAAALAGQRIDTLFASLRN